MPAAVPPFPLVRILECADGSDDWCGPALSALTAISEALDKLNRKAGGLGARLDSEVIPPATPDQDWRTRVIPRWRRNPGGAMLPYDNVTNTAQEKLFSIHLVLASLLAAPTLAGAS